MQDCQITSDGRRHLGGVIGTIEDKNNLSQLIKNQDLIYDVDQNTLKEIKNYVKFEKSKQYQDTFTKIKQTLENDRSRLKLLELSVEPTA